jgi:hypothetical protein
MRGDVIYARNVIYEKDVTYGGVLSGSYSAASAGAA